MKTFVIALLTLVALTASLATADDFMPPDWRGDPLSVMVEWDFIADFNPDPMNILPDQLVTVGDGIHPLGTAWTHAHASDSVHWADDPNQPGDGVAMTDSVPGEIDFFLVNWTDDYEFKHIWIQITYGGEGVPFVTEVVGPNPDDNSWTNPTFGYPRDMFDVDPNHRVEYWMLMPNPDREHIYIHIPPYTWVDQVVIDTISTPEPVATEARTWSDVKGLFE